MLSIEFQYRKKSFFALARIKETSFKREYVITVMNGELESLLYGNHIFLIDEGKAVSVTQPGNEHVAELKDCICAALNSQLEVKEHA